jgi:8-amino-7-oxononanoate synthase
LTAIVPVLRGSDERAFTMTREAQQDDIFVLPVVSPAVPESQSRLRLSITAAHGVPQTERAIDVIASAAGILES